MLSKQLHSFAYNIQDQLYWMENPGQREFLQQWGLVFFCLFRNMWLAGAMEHAFMEGVRYATAPRRSK